MPNVKNYLHEIHHSFWVLRTYLRKATSQVDFEINKTTFIACQLYLVKRQLHRYTKFDLLIRWFWLALILFIMKVTTKTTKDFFFLIFLPCISFQNFMFSINQIHSAQFTHKEKKTSLNLIWLHLVIKPHESCVSTGTHFFYIVSIFVKWQ